MVDVALNHADKLQNEFRKTWFVDKYKYYNFDSYYEEYKPSIDTWNKMEFVSIYKDKLIGYISYNIDRCTNNCYGLRIINFTESPGIFGVDLYKVLRDIFFKFKFNKLKWSVAVGNPAEEGYNKIINKIGGRIVGVYKQDIKLWDGSVVDAKVYEILRKDLINNIEEVKE